MNRLSTFGARLSAIGSRRSHPCNPCNPWLILVFLVTCLQSADAITNTITFPITSFAQSAATNRPVLITPLQLTPATNQIASYDRLRLFSDTNGLITITNMMAGLYQVDIQAPPDKTTFAILVPTTTGTYSADTLQVAMPRTVNRPQDYPYSAQASDARYYRLVGAPGGLLTNNYPDTITAGGFDGGTFTGSNFVATAGFAGFSGDGSGLTNILGYNIDVFGMDIVPKAGGLEVVGGERTFSFSGNGGDHWLSSIPIVFNGSGVTNLNAKAMPIIDADTISATNTIKASNIWDRSNVKWWGANGDRATDDTAAIQSTFDVATNSGGGTIFFPPGIYNITALQFGNMIPPDTRTNGWIIKGSGPQATTLRITTNGAIGLNLIGQFNLSVQDMTIDTAPGVTAQTAAFVARDTTSYSCNWVHFKNVYFRGTYSKAVVVHMAAEMCTYKDCTFQPANAVPCLYTAADNTDIGITNNQGAFSANTTTANAVRDCHFLAYVAGSSGFKAYGSVGWTLENNWFGTDQATNAMIYLKCSTNAGFMSWGGGLICRDNIYEGAYGQPYYLDNNHPTWTGQYYNVIDTGSTFNVSGSPTHTASMFTLKYPAVSLLNCDLEPAILFGGCSEQFTSVGNTRLLFPRGNSTLGTLQYPTRIDITYGMIKSVVQADIVSVGPFLTEANEVHSATNDILYGTSLFSGLTGPAINVNTNVLVVETNRVSVTGTTALNGLTTVKGAIGWGSLNSALRVDGNMGAAGGGQSIDFWNSAVFASYPLSRIASGMDASGNNMGDIIFLNGLNGGAPSEKMRIKWNSYVGIGTNNPQAALHVIGTNRADYFVGDGAGLTGIVARGNAAELTNYNGSAASLNWVANSNIVNVASFVSGSATNASTAYLRFTNAGVIYALPAVVITNQN